MNDKRTEVVETDDAEKAIKVAERIKDAILKKIPRHAGYVRRYTSGETGFIEIALRPDGAGSRSQEITTAYSDEYFLSATKENISDKAKRILNDFKLMLGAK